MALPVELNPYEHVKCVQMYGWKCLICSLEAKDQVGLELQHIANGIVYIDGIDGSKWVCCNKCRKTYHLSCVCPNQPEPTKLPFSVPFWNANSRRVTKPKVKRVMFKWIIITVLVANRKKGKPHPTRPEWRDKDGRRIGVRKAASSGLGKKEQKWTEEQINQCFVLWEQNNDLPLEQKRSKRQISIECGVPYTTVCERLSGRRGGGKKGKIAGGKQQGKVLDTGKSKRVIKQVISRNILTETNWTNHPLDFSLE